MKVFYGLDVIRHPFCRPIVTLGAFDGIHRAHRLILRRVIQRARRLHGTSILLTFDPHPLKVLRSDQTFLALTCIEHRLHLLSSLGLNVCVVARFTKRFSRLSATAFIEKILVKRLRVHELWIGFDYVFGRDREGDIALLREYGKRYGFRVKRISEMKLDGKRLSSTQIRKSVVRGKLVEVSRSLGRPYSLYGKVVRGKGRGRHLGYPTANLQPYHEAIPPEGVYGVKVFFRDVKGGRFVVRLRSPSLANHPERSRGRKRPSKGYLGILNIGNRPTFGSDEGQVIEVHLLDFQGDLYGKELEVAFLKRIRPERRFSNEETLINRIRRDKAVVRQLFG